MDGDRPGVDCPGQRVAVTVDDIPALRDERGQAFLASSMVAEHGQIKDPQRDQGYDAGIHQHPEHQPLVHNGEHLAALADESEPLGPWRDESGRRCVHRSAAIPLEVPECLAGSGASGSTFAMRTGFVTALAETSAGLSTDLLGTGFGASAFLTAGLSVLLFSADWAAARPGLTGDLLDAGLAVVAGLSAELAIVWGNVTIVRAGTS